MEHTSVRSLAAARTFRLFRQVALVEGITTLVLFFVAMPIKYIGGNPTPVLITGWIHGVAFIAYVLLMCAALYGRGWSIVEWGRTLLAAFVPFGTFANDRFLREKETDRTRPVA